jgi:hypothetical protein
MQTHAATTMANARDWRSLYPVGGLRRAASSTFLLLFVIAFGLSSCTTARINHFKQFAQAGTSYADAARAVIDEAGDTVVDADSLTLEKARAMLSNSREGMTGDALKEQVKQDSKLLAGRIKKHNELLRARLEILGDIQKHMLLLRNYFVALGALAESNEPSGIGDAAKGTVDALGLISKRIKEAKIGELPVADFVKPVTTIIVSQFQRVALERELKERAVIITNELDLQKAALEAISLDMRDNLRLVQEDKERSDVLIPYSSAAKPLPANWAAKRKEFLKKDIKLKSVEAAASGAEELKLSFIALVENRFDLSDAEALIHDINRIVDVIEGVRGSKEAKVK